jgi:hypothetical protein
LTRSLVLVDLLARRGIPSSLVIGVGSEEGFMLTRGSNAKVVLSCHRTRGQSA